MMPKDNPDLTLLVDAAYEAGAIAQRYFRKDPEVWMKGNQSPVSEADMAVDTYLKDVCLKARPDYGWLSEETTDNPERLSRDQLFIVDPIDGTRVFLAGDDQWTVSIAIARGGRPTVAALFNPTRNEMMTAVEGQGAWLNGEALTLQTVTEFRPKSISGPKVFINHAAFDDLKDMNGPYVGSLAYRFALVATGGLLASTARARAHDWDLAAADLIVCEAGGHVTDLDGNLIRYNKSEPRHPALVAVAPGLYDPFVDRVRHANIDSTS